MLGQRQQMLALAGVGDPVQREQVSYVPLLKAHPAVLDPADLRSGRPDLISGVLGTDAGRLAQAAQLGAEQDPQHSRTADGVDRCEIAGLATIIRVTIGRDGRRRDGTGRDRSRRERGLGRVRVSRLLRHAHHRSRATCQDAATPCQTNDPASARPVCHQNPAELPPPGKPGLAQRPGNGST